MISKLYMIRGARILNQMEMILEASSFRKLRDNLKFLRTKKRQFATAPVTIQSSTINPAIEAGILKIEAVAMSEGKKYNTVVQFEGIRFEDSDTKTSVAFTGGDGEEYYVKHIELKRKNVKVSCSCLDFYHRFSEHNSRDNSLYGNPPPPYTPKTDRASDNPRKVPGVCKHIIKTVESLKQSGLVR